MSAFMLASIHSLYVLNMFHVQHDSIVLFEYYQLNNYTTVGINYIVCYL